MAGDRSVLRYTHVMTTRRKWSAAEKRAIVAEIDVAGGSVSEVARKHGVHTSLLFRWRRDLVAVQSRPDSPRSTSNVFRRWHCRRRHHPLPRSAHGDHRFSKSNSPAAALSASTLMSMQPNSPPSSRSWRRRRDPGPGSHDGRRRRPGVAGHPGTQTCGAAFLAWRCWCRRR